MVKVTFDLYLGRMEGDIDEKKLCVVLFDLYFFIKCVQ